MSATAWTLRVTIADIVTLCLEAHTAHGTDQPVGTCTLLLPLPLGAHVVDGASVVVEVAQNGTYLDPLFTGIFRNPDRTLTVSGKTATLLCEGANYRLTYPLEKDIAYAGGARVAPATIISAASHVGDDTISWYDNTTANGIAVDATAAPATDSNFVWLTGLVHGSNSYDASTGDKKIKSHSKIQVIQNGIVLGYAFLPVSNEQWSSMLGYTNRANWDTFELFVAAAIQLADGTITFRFLSGYKPGTSQRDEYEVDQVQWQTAGDVTAREVIRGLYKRAGFTAGTYSVNQITDLDGNVVELGGNGLVDAGQVRVGATEMPLSFASRVAGLFGFAAFDCGDGTPRVRPMRGQPTGTAAAAFTEGIDFDAVRRTSDARNVSNSVRVDGASGNDQNGKRFAYSSQTATIDVVPNAAIPTPPGISMLRISDSLLVSNDLCADVREIAEVNHAEAAVEVSWETWPHALNPASVVAVSAPTVEFDGLLFLKRIAHDIDASGFRTSMTGWAGASVPFTETPDPDESEVDREPTDARPATEWVSFRPNADVD